MMLCALCQCSTTVTDSRPAGGGFVVRRRRRCMNHACGQKTTTYEVDSTFMARVNKLLSKKQVDFDRLRRMIQDVEDFVNGAPDLREIDFLDVDKKNPPPA